MIEVLTFFNSVSKNKWISSLWIELKQIHKGREKELDDINKIMFGDPLELAKYYVEPDCQEINPADRRVQDEMVTRQPVMVKIDQFLKQPVFHHGSNQLFILSDAGMGKSALLAMLKLMHLTKYWPQSRACALKKLGNKSIEQINRIQNQRKTILLLDSLDEDPLAYGQVKDRIINILEASQNFAKVIITCRTQFFPQTENHPLELPGQVCIGPYRCYSKYLSFFDQQKVDSYLTKRFAGRFFGKRSNQKSIADAKYIIDKMGSLSCRPMLLSYIEDLMTSPLILEGTSEYYLFDALLDSWLRREVTKKKDINIEDLQDACIILAVWMQCYHKRQISEAELDKLIQKISKVKAIAQIDMKGRSFLNRNSDGDYRFSHYSIQEFLIAKFLCEKPILRIKKKIRISHQIIKMLNEAKKINPEVLFNSLDMCPMYPLEETKRKITQFGLEFVYVPSGILFINSSALKNDRGDYEKRPKVFLIAGFYMQTTPITQAQWKKVMGRNPSHHKGNGNRPVESVSWEDVKDFINRLNNTVGKTIFGLPSEAMWEYACRAGTQTTYNRGDLEEDLKRAAWYYPNSNGTSHPVAQKEPNAFGLYDMHGNVDEWVEDDWHDNFQNAPLDGTAWIDNPRKSIRVVRGGSWCHSSWGCTSTHRLGLESDLRNDYMGFRLVLLPDYSA